MLRPSPAQPSRLNSQYVFHRESIAAVASNHTSFIMSSNANQYPQEMLQVPALPLSRAVLN
jgi:hypothetical protein